MTYTEVTDCEEGGWTEPHLSLVVPRDPPNYPAPYIAHQDYYIYCIDTYIQQGFTQQFSSRKILAKMKMAIFIITVMKKFTSF